MRIGTNPQKEKIETLVHKRHRVILPFWIPNVDDEYFKNQPEVLYWCLKSLTETINPYETNVTLINNNSCNEASVVAEEFVKNGLIDKYVVRNGNRGKLEVILAEARSSYEDYITISDADFLFFNGWEDANIEVFETFSSAGLVTCYPCPNLATYYNSAWLWSLKRRAGKIVTDHELNLVEKGLGNTPENGIFTGLGVKRKTMWRQKQYYLKSGNFKACLGATHALATIKRDIIQFLPLKKVEYVFKNGYEHDYLDFKVERMGYYRLSTIKCYAYHMGNSIPIELTSNYQTGIITQKVFPDYKPRNEFLNGLLYRLSALIMSLFRKTGIL